MSKDLINIMLDLETLSSEPDAAIIQIGAVVCPFDLTYLPIDNVSQGKYEFERTIAYDSVIAKVQAKVVSQSLDTMLWWEKQPNKLEVFSGQESYYDALACFVEWIKQIETDSGATVAMWGNGVDFDNVILRHSLDAFGHHNVWGYKGNRCFRTIKNMFPLINPQSFTRTEGEQEHNALGDARFQARWLELIREDQGWVNL